ncbi:MAG: hypothetical protein ACOZBZ_03940 [Patescibacteria group bacterium]
MSQKLLITIITLMIVISFLGYIFSKFYKQNIGPDYCYKRETNLKMSRKEALKIALKSVCVKEGKISPLGWECNDYSGTWWFPLIVFGKAKGCSPACVVDIATKNAQVNWRCTGLIP